LSYFDFVFGAGLRTWLEIVASWLRRRNCRRWSRSEGRLGLTNQVNVVDVLSHIARQDHRVEHARIAVDQRVLAGRTDRTQDAEHACAGLGNRRRNLWVLDQVLIAIGLRDRALQLRLRKSCSLDLSNQRQADETALADSRRLDRIDARTDKVADRNVHEIVL